jgi:hypothetical protein
MNRSGIDCLRPATLGVVLLLVLPFVAGCSPSEKTLTVFEDVTAQSGLGEYEGMTHGAAWGDYDGDGLPDLYVTNHLKQAMLFRNVGGGRFADVTADVLTQRISAATSTARPGRISTTTATRPGAVDRRDHGHGRRTQAAVRQ